MDRTRCSGQSSSLSEHATVAWGALSWAFWNGMPKSLACAISFCCRPPPATTLLLWATGHSIGALHLAHCNPVRNSAYFALPPPRAWQRRWSNRPSGDNNANAAPNASDQFIQGRRL